MSGAYVDAVGFVAPGLASWAEARAVLIGDAPLTSGALVAPQPTLLPANERRRAPLGVRLALHAAEQALAGADVDADTLAAVFATSDADMDVVHRLCVALAEEGRSVSPTDFHNSVHNAASGYWSIGVQARGPSTTLSAYDFSFAAGLREALTQVGVDGSDVVLVAFDVAPPPPLFASRPVALSAAVALLLRPRPGVRSLARLTLVDDDSTMPTCAESRCHASALEQLRQASPALRALPLLQCIARRETAFVGLRAHDALCFGLRVTPP